MFYKVVPLLLMLCVPLTAFGGDFTYEYGASSRALGGYFYPKEKIYQNQNRVHAPVFANINGSLTYNFSDTASLKLATELEAKASSHLDNLNQGRWGEEVFAKFSTAFGDFYVGQMENPAAMLGVTKPNLSVWQINPTDVTDFTGSTNWRQHNRTKYYNTLTSTLINTDGSSFKLSYLTPEFKGTTLAIGFTPENNANDGLTSKFAPYYGKSSYQLAIYNYHDFDTLQTEIYAAFADFDKSHQEYAAGFSIYRKGLTLFSSFRQTETSSSDYKITTTNTSKNTLAYFDAFRNGFAFNAGVSYEFAFLTSVLSYFESKADNVNMRNRMITLHNSFKPYKHLGFYLGAGFADLENEIDGNAKGPFAYAGIELTF